MEGVWCVVLPPGTVDLARPQSAPPLSCNNEALDSALKDPAGLFAAYLAELIDLALLLVRAHRRSDRARPPGARHRTELSFIRFLTYFVNYVASHSSISCCRVTYDEALLHPAPRLLAYVFHFQPNV